MWIIWTSNIQDAFRNSEGNLKLGAAFMPSTRGTTAPRVLLILVLFICFLVYKHDNFSRPKLHAFLDPAHSLLLKLQAHVNAKKRQNLRNKFGQQLLSLTVFVFLAQLAELFI